MNPDNLPPSPMENASFLSKVFFCWILDLFRLGAKRDLELSDLYRLFPDIKSENVGHTLTQAWREQINEAEKWNSVNKYAPRSPSLFKALVKVFFWQVTGIGLLVFLNEGVIKIGQPILLGLIIRQNAGDYDKTEGYIFGLIMGVALVFYAVQFHIFFILSVYYGMKIRVACSALIYGKALKLSQSAIGQSNVGQMVNLLANDVNRFDVSVNFLHFLWVGPVTLGIIQYILWGFYGWPSVLGIIILILFIPLQGVLGKIVGNLRLQVAERTDYRVRIMSEIVNAVRIIKMYAWEFPFAKLVSDARVNEIKYIRKTAFVRAINVSFYYISSNISLFLTLLVFVLIGEKNTLVPETVFVTFFLYNNVRVSMTYYFPHAIIQVAEALASIKRLQEFLLMDERVCPIEPPKKRKDRRDNRLSTATGGEVIVSNVSAGWCIASCKPVKTLDDISLKVPEGKFVAVVGPVGSGKTSLLQVLLRELPTMRGVVEIKGTVAYTSQEAWIFSGTVRDNILFGRDYDYDRYQRVIHACALTKDLTLLPLQDLSLVGDRGSSLSGGQKARINLARAVYSDADIYLLDDPLSAVDAEVAKHIFENCIMGILKEKAKILVTHQLQFLKPADEIILLDRGKVEARGSYKELLQTGMDFAQALQDEKVNRQSEDSLSSLPGHSLKLKGMGYDQRPKSSSSHIWRRSSASLPELGAMGNGSIPEDTEWDDESMIFESRSHRSASYRENRENARNTIASSNVFGGEEFTPLTSPPEEKNESSGGVSLHVYWKYITAGAPHYGLLLLLGFNILVQLIFSGSVFWLQYWTKNQGKTEEEIKRSKTTYVYIYCGLTASLFIVSLIRNTAFLNVCLNSSIELHRRLYEGVMRAPMRFFEINPAGRVLNRFAKDIGFIDELLPITAFEAMDAALNFVGAVTIVSLNIPYLAIPSFTLAACLYLIRRYYLKTARSVRRLEGIARSPVFAHLRTSIYGITTIRAMGAENQFKKQFDAHLDLHSAAWFIHLATARYMGVLLDFCRVLYVTTVVFTVLALKGGEEGAGSVIGVSIASAISLTGIIQWGIRQSAETEILMVSAERVLEYAEVEPEAALESTPEHKPPNDWPTRGEIVLKDLVMRYGEDDPVLKNVDCVFKSQEKVGIVGRTGAGKSSLITALFRITEPYKGRIEIDGINVLKIGLHDLRQKISIIPQDPVLFNTTLRINLDPFEEFQDEVLWAALGDVHLADPVKDSPAGLDMQIAENGSNFSVGQRQLICLARAILRRSTMLVLDEATAAVDHLTDALIQRTIREKFEQCTVLTIAHRLNTVMDSDRILVLDAGEVKEFDAPYNLLRNEQSILAQLVKTTGKATAATLFTMAEMAYNDKRTHTSDEYPR